MSAANRQGQPRRDDDDETPDEDDETWEDEEQDDFSREEEMAKMAAELLTPTPLPHIPDDEIGLIGANPIERIVYRRSGKPDAECDIDEILQRIVQRARTFMRQANQGRFRQGDAYIQIADRIAVEQAKNPDRDCWKAFFAMSGEDADEFAEVRLMATLYSYDEQAIYLSWPYFVAAATVQPDRRKELLTRAEEEGWTLQQLRDAIAQIPPDL